MIQIHRLLPIVCAVLVVAGCSTQPAADSSSSATDGDEPPRDHESTPKATEADGQEDGAVDPPPYDKPPPPDREYDISEVYAQMCASCHGDRGEGDGVDDDGFAFDTPADEWTNSPTVGGILDTLEDGIHDTAMRDFPQFKDVDRVELAEYVIDLRHALDDSP